MKGKQFTQRLRRIGVDIIEGRGKGGHCLARYNGRQATIPIHGDVDLGNIFIKKFVNNSAFVLKIFKEVQHMIQAYPVILTKDGNSLIAEFPDVAEAITVGSDEDNALAWALDALIVALSGYLDDRRDIPQPSRAKAKQKIIILPPLIASKLAIYQTMRDQGITQAQLADKLHCDARQIRRLLDLDHHSRLDLIDDALHALGKKLIIDIRAA